MIDMQQGHLYITHSHTHNMHSKENRSTEGCSKLERSVKMTKEVVIMSLDFCKCFYCSNHGTIVIHFFSNDAVFN